jgi:hypothetical protein
MVGDDCLVELATSSTPELRFLAVQGRAFTLFLWGVYFVDKNFNENDWLECVIRPHLLIFNSLKSFQLY